MAARTAAVDRTAPDYDEIVRVLHVYSDAFGAGDVDRFKEIFYEEAWIFYTGPDGALIARPIAECFEEWARPAQGHAVGRIITVTQAGDIANVLLGWDRPQDPANQFVDLHNLIRVDGKWKISNKTATHTSRPGARNPVRRARSTKQHKAMSWS